MKYLLFSLRLQRLQRLQRLRRSTHSIGWHKHRQYVAQFYLCYIEYYLVENKTLMNFMKINMQIKGPVHDDGEAVAAAVPYRILARARATTTHWCVNEIIFYKFHILAAQKW